MSAADRSGRPAGPAAQDAQRRVGAADRAGTGRVGVGAAVAAERRTLAHALHAGIAQQLTVLSLTVDAALLHDEDGDGEQVRAALHAARRTVDAAATECRQLIAALRASGDA